MRHRVRVTSPHQDALVVRARAFFSEERGPEGAAKRAAEIDALPLVGWKGQTLRTLRCTGQRGRGPHDQNVPEAQLWSLIDLRRWRCPFHT